MSFLNSPVISARPINATEIAHDNRQMMLPFEFTAANDAEPEDDPFAVNRWEDEGGAIGRETYGD
jgi:hypothetical protein